MGSASKTPISASSQLFKRHAIFVHGLQSKVLKWNGVEYNGLKYHGMECNWTHWNKRENIRGCVFNKGGEGFRKPRGHVKFLAVEDQSGDGGNRDILCS